WPTGTSALRARGRPTWPWPTPPRPSGSGPATRRRTTTSGQSSLTSAGSKRPRHGSRRRCGSTPGWPPRTDTSAWRSPAGTAPPGPPPRPPAAPGSAPGRAPPRLALGEALVRLGNLNAAAPLYAAAITLDPGLSVARERLARALALRREPGKSLAPRAAP